MFQAMMYTVELLYIRRVLVNELCYGNRINDSKNSKNFTFGCANKSV